MAFRKSPPQSERDEQQDDRQRRDRGQGDEDGMANGGRPPLAR